MTTATAAKCRCPICREPDCFAEILEEVDVEVGVVVCVVGGECDRCGPVARCTRCGEWGEHECPLEDDE